MGLRWGGNLNHLQNQRIRIFMMRLRETEGEQTSWPREGWKEGCSQITEDAHPSQRKCWEHQKPHITMVNFSKVSVSSEVLERKVMSFKWF